MREVIRSYINQFKTSRPIFRMSLSNSKSHLEVDISEPIYQFDPNSITVNVDDDWIRHLVIKNFNEEFNPIKGIFEIDTYNIERRVISSIRSSFVEFIEKNIGMRNPRQSKLYRWAYRNMPNNEEFNNGLILLYKYMCTYIDGSYYIDSSNAVHLQNILALLEAMKEKYEES